MFEADQSLYMVIPIGYEEHTSVVIAKNDAEAFCKSMETPNISRAVNMYGSKLRLLNLTDTFANQGWDIFLAKKGLVH